MKHGKFAMSKGIGKIKRLVLVASYTFEKAGCMWIPDIACVQGTVHILLPVQHKSYQRIQFCDGIFLRFTQRLLVWQLLQ